MTLNSENACYYSALITLILQFPTLKLKDYNKNTKLLLVSTCLNPGPSQCEMNTDFVRELKDIWTLNRQEVTAA
jgi:hypothetical protein